MTERRQLHTLTTYNPHRGRHGHPYVIHATGPAGELERGYWTEADALDARDELLDAGWVHVRVVGLATHVVVVGLVELLTGGES